MRSGVHRLRTVYRLVWSTLCGLVGVPGLVAGVLLTPAQVILPILIVVAGIGLTVAATASSKPAETTARRRRSALIVGTMISATLACMGYVVLFGAAGPGLVVVLGVTSPAAMRWSGRTLSIPAGLDRSGGLTTAELCRQWQESYEDLRVATTAAARLRIVETRQHYLDELERRDPFGLTAWLGANASAAGDPSRFLARDADDVPPGDG
jgi:hypothetical protein